MSTYISSQPQPKLPTVPSVPLVPMPPPSGPTASLGQTTITDVIESRRNPVQYYVKTSFMITYILLLTTATITFIEAMRTKSEGIRHVLNLETCISLVAGYFYSVFLGQIEEFGKNDAPVDWHNITKTRYVDWAITTPMMLLTLCVVLGMESKRRVGLFTITAIVLLNYAMLYLGYLGEAKAIDKMTACFAGYIPFVIMFGLIFMKFVDWSKGIRGNILYFLYLLVWGLYGLVYIIDESYKNIIMNILDCIAKCLIGLGLWAYYTKIIVLNP